MKQVQIGTMQIQRNILGYTVMAVVGVLFLVVAYHVFDHNSFFYFLFKELGFALIVAICLVFTIEKFSREHHAAEMHETIEEIKTNLFYAIFKRYIPEAVFEQVEKSVMEADVFRSNHELDYTIEKLDADRVSCFAQTSYTLTSVVDAAIEHPIVVNLEMPIDEHIQNLCQIESLTVGGQTLALDQLAPYVTRSHEHVTLRYPYIIRGRATVKVMTQSRLVKRLTDVELWASRIPSDGLVLTVSTPDRSLTVCAHANHSEKLDTVIDNASTKKWRLDHGIFPYQSIMFWWKPKQDTVPREAEVAAAAKAVKQ